MKNRYKLPLVMALLAANVLAGCSAPKPPREKVFWPAPPDQPRMEWITTYATKNDFDKSERERRLEKFVGVTDETPFGKPLSAASQGDGVVYVSDLDRGEIRVIDFNNKTSEAYLKQSPVVMPIGLAISRGGALFVADSQKMNVVEFSPKRKVVRQFGVDVLGKPTFIALDEERGRLYVSDVAKHEVVVFDLVSGEKLFAFNGEGGPAGRMYGPQGIAIDKQGRIFVAEQLAARVQVFDSEGQSLYVFGKRTDRQFDFEAPRGLAFDSNDNLFVTDVRKSSLLVFTPEGRPLTMISTSRYSHVLGFSMPSGVYIDVNDRIYIADGLNRRITIWQMLTPAYLAEHPLDTAAARD